MMVKKRLGILLTSFIVCAFIFVFQSADVSAEATRPDAGYVIDEDFSFLSALTPGNSQPSGWDVRAAGGALVSLYNTNFKISDTSKDLPVSMSKKFVAQSAGNLTMEFRIRPMSVIDGLKWQLLSNDVVGVSLITQNNMLSLETSPTTVLPLQTYVANVEVGIKIDINLSTHTTDVYINGVKKANGATFKNAVSNLNQFQVQTGAASLGDFFFGPLKMYRGYAVNERLISVVAGGAIPQDWSAVTSGGAITVGSMLGSPQPDINSMKLSAASSTGSMSLSKAISPMADNFTYDFKVLYKQKADGLEAELKSGTTSVIKLTTFGDDLAYVNSSGQPVSLKYKYLANLWTHIQIKVNWATATADIYINDKRSDQVVPLAPGAVSVDTLKFTTSSSYRGEMWLDDILLYKTVSLPADYVPAPQAVSKGEDDPVVGVQSCPMWREGHHLGWDMIQPYPDRTPLLGFYDEGSPETADWETKWLIEHGINFQMSCWFRPLGGDTDRVPIKDSYLSHALDNGYFNSQYRNQIDFAIMFENLNSKVKDAEDFRTNLIPYWIEYYFKDPRYLKIDNKPVFTIYNYDELVNAFKGSENVKPELDNLRSEMVKAGFKGIILLNVYNGTDPQQLAKRKAAGFDGVYAYSWGSFGGHPEFQKLKMTQEKDANAIDIIPGLSMGRDDTAWGLNFGYYATPSEFQSLAQWTKDSFMPSLPAGSLGKKLVMLDNWNEFGEGHFIMPAGLAGFGYVDAIRNVFGDSASHIDSVPTQAQKDRINTLYPAGRVVPNLNQPQPVMTNVYGNMWEFNTPGDAEGWTVEKQIVGVTVQDGTFSGLTNNTDPGIRSADHLGIKAEDIPYLVIRMKNGTNDIDGRFFFTTEADGTWNEAKAVGFYVKPQDNEYTEYVIEAWQNKNWTGTIRQLRIDPTSSVGPISIDYIRTIYSPQPGIRTYVDGVYKPFSQPALLKDGIVMLPMKETYLQIGAKPEWDPSNDTLVAVKDNVVYRLKVGDSVAYKGSQAITLEHAPVKLANGTVMAPLSYLRQAFGAIAKWDAPSQIVRVYPTAITWDFTTSSGWTANSQIANPVVANGVFSGTSKGTSGSIQPAILSPDDLQVAASDIRRIRVRMNNMTSGDEAKIYFTTTADSNWNEAKMLSSYILPTDAVYREYVFDTSSLATWTGTIKQLQVVPTTASGAFSLDSVQLEITPTVAVKGDNLIDDPGFEGSKASQFAMSDATYVKDPSQFHSGHQSVKIIKTTRYGGIKFPVSVEKGKSYTYSAWAKLANGASTSEPLRLGLQYNLDGVTKQFIMFTSPGLKAGDWTQVEGTYTIQESGEVTNVLMYLYTEANNPGSVYYVDDVAVKPITNTGSSVWVHPLSVSLNATSLAVGRDKTKALVPAFTPANVSNKELIWRSSNPSVATVDVNGMVYGVSLGTATVTATTVDGGKTASVLVTVDATVAVTGLSLTPSTLSLTLGDKQTLVPTVTPANATNKLIKWESVIPTVAAVDADGTVTGVGTGSTQIKATSDDSGIQTVATVTVTAPTSVVKGSNLIVDPGMEGSTLAAPNYAYQAVPTMTSAEHHSGQQSLLLTKTDRYGGVKFPVPLVKGKPYYYSAWAKLASGSTTTETIRIGLQYKVDGKPIPTQYIMFTSPPLSATEWKQVQGSLIINETGVVTETTMFLYTEIIGTGNPFYVDDVEIRPLTVDNIPPITVSDAPSGWVTTAQVVHLTATDGESGVAGTFYSLDHGVYTSGNTVSIAGEGVHTLDFYSKDVAGNQEAAQTVTVRIDGTAPVTTAAVQPSTPDGASGAYVSPVTVALTAADNASSVAGIVYSTDNGTTWLPYTAALTFDKQGAYTLLYRAIDAAGNSETAKNVSFNLAATTVKVQLKDSTGNPLSGGIVKYLDGTWKEFGVTDASGYVSKSLGEKSYLFSMTYEGKAQELTQNIGMSASVVFQTQLVQVQLQDSQGNPLDGGSVKFFSSGSWRAVGTTAGGKISMEVFPETYTFGLTFEGKYKEIVRSTAASSTVVFNTVKVNVQLKDSQGNPLDGAVVDYYSGGSWRPMGTTVSGEISRELLADSYTFGLTYAGKRKETIQNAVTNSVVSFQTVKAILQVKDSLGNLLSGGSAKLYSGGSWQNLGPATSGEVSKELLPGSYSFSMTYGGTTKESTWDISVDPVVVFQY
ncbi:OmpL47-type beta-barrel domain-containing protein [Paenibacillus alba]|uniref:OmpL47-type beta-barrel domain-containing protein n=1 Tax=Paenibacillus alba TaxID=1197127 RepID=UPI001563B60A|nr:Ig-like domain-containing protein [Paenibacillus alba]